MATRPLGYASVSEFEAHLGQTLEAEDQAAAEVYLRTAEAVVAYHTGDRVFLPIQPQLAVEVDDDDTSFVFGSDAARLPGGGLLYLGSEIVKYGGLSIADDEARQVTLTISTRGCYGTTAAVHAVDTTAYLVRGYPGNGKSFLTLPDFLEFVTLWTGYANTSLPWTEATTTYLAPMPQDELPHTELHGYHFARGSTMWVAAVWGYDYVVPDGIKTATMRIAEEVLRRRGSNATVVKSTTLEHVTSVYREPTVLPPDVWEILSTFKRYSC